LTGIEELGQVKLKRVSWYIYLEEKNILPSGYSASEYESKGFYAEKYVQDFPIRGKSVYLVIKRRRWRLKETPSQEISTDCLFITEGSKLTRELSDFLKGTGRDPRRYDNEHS
jgi:transposase